jgi:uncharacterized BrkB/YihY/UPF0761 family membrane protein
MSSRISAMTPDEEPEAPSPPQSDLPAGEEGTTRSPIARSRALVARSRARAAEVRRQAEARRGESVLVDVGFLAVEHDGQVAGGVLAGAVAFRIFLFVVPFVFVVVAGFGLASHAFDKPARHLAEQAGVTGLLATSISTVDGKSLGTKLTIFLVAGFALVAGARTLVLVLNAVHVLAWRLPRTKLRRAGRAVAGLIGVVLAAGVLVHVLAVLRDRSLLALFAGSVLTVGVVTVFWTWTSLKVLPHPQGALVPDVLPGALVLAVGLELLRLFTVVYVSRAFVAKSEVYGAIGGSLALLLWAYVLGRIITASAVVNAAYWYRRHGPAIPEPDVGDQRS